MRANGLLVLAAWVATAAIVLVAEVMVWHKIQMPAERTTSATAGTTGMVAAKQRIVRAMARNAHRLVAVRDGEGAAGFVVGFGVGT